MVVHKLFCKMRGSRGETLVETLAAILIASLSVALLFTFVTAAGDMDKKAREKDYGYTDEAGVKHVGDYEALSKAEKSDDSDTSAVSSTVNVSGTGGATPTFSVKIYGGNGMYSYKEVTP